jgi:hypothetical protein
VEDTHGGTESSQKAGRQRTVSDAELFRQIARARLFALGEGFCEAAEDAGFRIGTSAEIQRLAALRGLPTQAVCEAQRRDLLRFGTFWKQTVWAATDRSGQCCVLRRLDGRPWSQGRKAIMLPGSKGRWPLGIFEAQEMPVVFLTEGSPDMIAAHVGIREDERVICMPSTSARFGPLVKRRPKSGNANC